MTGGEGQRQDEEPGESPQSKSQRIEMLEEKILVCEVTDCFNDEESPEKRPRYPLGTWT